jgi:ankyrin repeat protein
VNADPDPNPQCALQSACRRGHEGIDRLLLEAGADPNCCFSGTPPLADVPPDSLSLVQLLLDAGADVNAKRVVCNAAKSGNMPFLKLLVEAGANVNVEMTSGYAYGNGSGEALKAAAEKGAC